MKALLPEIEGRDKGRITALGDLLQGEVMLAQGDLDGAPAVSRKACGPGSSFWDQFYTWPFNEYKLYHMDLAASIFAEKGDATRAIAEYENLLRLAESGSSFFYVHPLYHYRLGLLYERAGEVAKAKAQYERFLDLWKDAYPGQPEVEDAKTRLSGLKGK